MIVHLKPTSVHSADKTMLGKIGVPPNEKPLWISCNKEAELTVTNQPDGLFIHIWVRITNE